MAEKQYRARGVSNFNMLAPEDADRKAERQRVAREEDMGQLQADLNPEPSIDPNRSFLPGYNNPDLFVKENNEITNAEAIGIYLRDESLTSNLYQMGREVYIEEKYGIDRQPIIDNIDSLTKDLAPAYHSDVLNEPNIFAAKAKADDIRQRLEGQKQLNTLSFGQQALTNIGAVVIDPLTWATGLGVGATTQIAFGRILSGSVVKQATKVGIMGAGEEAILQAPRLEVDPTLEMQDYYTYVASGFLFGGSLSVVGSGAKAIKNTPFVSSNIRKGMEAASDSYAAALLTEAKRSMDGKHKSGGAAARKDSIKERVGDVAHDVKEEATDLLSRATRAKNKFQDITARARRRYVGRVTNKEVRESVEAAMDGTDVIKQQEKAGLKRIQESIKLREGDTDVLKGKELNDIDFEDLQKAMPEAHLDSINEVYETLVKYQDMNKLSEKILQTRNLARSADSLAKEQKLKSATPDHLGNKFEETVSTDIDQWLAAFSKFGREDIRSVADQLIGNVKAEDLKVIFKNFDDLDSLSPELKQHLMNRRAAGKGDPSGVNAHNTDEVILNTARKDSEQFQETLLHELVHTVTSAKQRGKIATTTLEREGIDELRKLYNEIEALQKNPEFLKGLNKQQQARLKTIVNDRELVAYGTTNKVFRELTEQMPNNFKVRMDSALEKLMPKTILTTNKLAVSNYIKSFTKLDSKFKKGLNQLGDISEDMANYTTDPAARARVQYYANTLYDNLERKLSDISIFTKNDESIRLLSDNALDYAAEVQTQIKHLELAMNNKPVDPVWKDVSDSFQEEVDPAILRQLFSEANLATKALRNQLGPLTHSLSSRLMGSDVPLAQWVAFNLFESPSGYGGLINRPQTAAILAEQLNAQHSFPILKGYQKLMDTYCNVAGKSKLSPNRYVTKHASALRDKDVRKINEMVMLESNRRRLGKETTELSEGEPMFELEKAVNEFVDLMHDGYGKLHDLQLASGIHGVHAGNKLENYQPQRYNDDRITLLLNEKGGAEALEELLTRAIHRGGKPITNAREIAKTMVAEKKHRASKSSYDNLNIEDDQLVGNFSIKGEDTPGYMMHRVDMDYTTELELPNGGTLRLLDILDPDVPGSFDRYAKEATARTALADASDGLLRGDVDFDNLIDAINKQAYESGKTVNTRDIQNAIRMMLGRAYDGQLNRNLRMIRDATALSSMGGFGESQLAEFGMALNRGVAGLSGLATVNKSRKQRIRSLLRLLPNEEYIHDRKFMLDLQELTGLHEDMYLVRRQNVNYDETGGKAHNFVDKVTGGKYRDVLQMAQAKVTGYGAIRTWEDQLAMASIMQDVVKHIKGQQTKFTSDARLRDMGWFDADDNMDWFKQYFKDDGVVKFDENGNIESLNLEMWKPEDQVRLGVILNRHTAQVIQRTFTGEMSPEMMNPTIAFSMQFKSYVLAAAEKQQVRGLNFRDKELFMQLALNAISSGIAREIRFLSLSAAYDERQEKSAEPYVTGGWNTFKYMGMAGTADVYKTMFSTTYGMATGKLDMGEALFNGFNNPFLPPTLNYVERGAKVVEDALYNEPLDKQLSSVRKFAPLGTTAPMNILFGMLDDAVTEE